MKSKIQTVLSRVLWKLGIWTAARKLSARRGCFVLEFHGVAKRLYADFTSQTQPGMTLDCFQSIMEWVAERFVFLTPRAFFAGSQSGVLLTFDDGLANHYVNVLPLLESFHAPAIFFVPTRHVINPKDWLPGVRSLVHSVWQEPSAVPEAVALELFDGLSTDQLAICAQHPLITIGAHSVNHPFLTRLSDGELQQELHDSKAFLEMIIQRPVSLIAYPSGDYNERVLQAVVQAGYKAGFAENSKLLGNLLFEIPRIGIYSSKAHYLAAKLSGLHKPPFNPRAIA